MGDSLTIIPVLWTQKYTLHIFGRSSCGQRQRTQTTKGITKSLIQMSVRDIHGEQELLLLGFLKLRKEQQLCIFIFERCSICLWCVNQFHCPINSPVMALRGICTAPNNPEGKGRQQVTELGGKKWCLARREHWFYNVQWRIYWQGGCDLADLGGAPLSFQSSCCGTSSICMEQRGRAFPRWAISPGRRRLNLSC